MEGLLYRKMPEKVSDYKKKSPPGFTDPL